MIQKDLEAVPGLPNRELTGLSLLTSPQPELLYPQGSACPKCPSVEPRQPTDEETEAERGKVHAKSHTAWVGLDKAM